MKTEFKVSDSVRVIRNIRNDGTYPGIDRGKILVQKGSLGYVQSIGTFLQDQIIYAVHFLDINKVIGCREEELLSKDSAWKPSLFEYRDKVTPNKILTVKNKIIARPGDVAEVLKVLPYSFDDDQAEIQYHVRFSGHTLQLPELVLQHINS